MQSSIRVTRRPKGRLALASVYSFTGASILASIIFSLLLFLSLDDNLSMKVLFGSLAVIFELGKFFAWYEYGERRAHGNMAGSMVALSFYAVLAIISIGGSIGGINSATNTIAQYATTEENRFTSFDRQIDALEAQIALNNQAAERYIALDRLTTGLARIQKENSELQQEILAIATQRDTLPIRRQESVLGLIDGLANSLNLSFSAAKLGLVIFLSVLLDLFAAFFVGLIGEELRFRHGYANSEAAYTSPHAATNVKTFHSSDEASHPLGDMLTAPKAAQINELPHESSSPYAEPSTTTEFPSTAVMHKSAVWLPTHDDLTQNVIHLISTAQIPCQKKAVAAHFALSGDQVDELFFRLLEQGLVEKKPNHHFQWKGQQQAA
ncbi:Preprotein translocase subunit SecY [Thaumasiovibrio sp. DFM-14]|uniref:Preprotein translocase subunit SecY n=1 Tax=Thaumasiovibrio sp. DFM-14 TaxID=3384792 RepID=UPI0039A3339D